MVTEVYLEERAAHVVSPVPAPSTHLFLCPRLSLSSSAFSYSSFLVSQTGKITHVDTLDGRDMSANIGNNPFRSGISSLAASGTYDVYASPSGNVTGLNPRQMKNQFAYNNKGTWRFSKNSRM